jgi:hypothetical protein
VTYKDFVSIEEFQGTRQLGKCNQKVEMNLREVGCENMNCIASARLCSVFGGASVSRAVRACVR